MQKTNFPQWVSQEEKKKTRKIIKRDPQNENINYLLSHSNTEEVCYLQHQSSSQEHSTVCLLTFLTQTTAKAGE